MKLSGNQLADRSVAKMHLDAFGKALQNIASGRWVSLTVGTVSDKVTIDFSSHPEVLQAVKDACMQKIAEANEVMLTNGGHLLQ